MTRLQTGTPTFRRWVQTELIPLLPGGADRWLAFASGAYEVEAGNEPLILRGILLQASKYGVTVWAYVEPLFSEHLLLSVSRQLTYSTKQGFARDGATGSLSELAASVSALWHDTDGEAHLAQCRTPAGLLTYIHHMYAKNLAHPWSCSDDEAACHILLGNLQAAMQVANVARPEPDEPLHIDPTLTAIRNSIESGADAARDRLLRIRDEQFQRHLAASN